MLPNIEYLLYISGPSLMNYVLLSNTGKSASSWTDRDAWNDETDGAMHAEAYEATDGDAETDGALTKTDSATEADEIVFPVGAYEATDAETDVGALSKSAAEADEVVFTVGVAAAKAVFVKRKFSSPDEWSLLLNFSVLNKKTDILYFETFNNSFLF